MVYTLQEAYFCMYVHITRTCSVQAILTWYTAVRALQQLVVPILVGAVVLRAICPYS